ncbi:MAG: hypothetical protein JO150_12060 [Acidobacteriaceae bacterium]|nr:hypothetical protein [Acidobacteriaceae bacterium]
MIKFRQLFFVFTLSLFVGHAWAQSNLTQISDTVLNPDGSPFNGTVVITWTGSGTSTGSAPAPYSTSAKIYNGVLSVSLAPSVTASSSGFYLATFNSKDGRLSWVETWQVGVSSAPLTLSQVRANVTSTTSSSGASTIAMGQVIGLSAYLNAISNSLNTMMSTTSGFNSTVNGLSSSVANLTNIVNNLSSTASTPSNVPTFFDGEIPQGTINGTNAVFNLTNAPNPATSLSLFRNGVLQKAGSDFTLSGSTITFLPASVPQSSDLVQASYRIGTAGQSSFVDNQVPSGAIDGTNLVFQLGSAPNPASSLRLYKNGILLMQSIDYNLTGSTVTFLSAATAPVSGDSLLTFYRVTN